MPLRSDWSEATCPIARTLDVVGDPWVMLVLREAVQGATRFEQFRGALGVADSVLSNRLSAMVEAGLMTRAPYRSGNRTRTGYVLTDAGADLLPVLHALVRWGDTHRPGPDGPLRIHHDDCGSETHRADSCSACGEALTVRNVSWRKPRDPSRPVQLRR